MSATKKVTLRTIMSGAAALPAVAVLPTMAAAAMTEPDPIFNAIEAHHQAYQILSNLCSALDEAGQHEELDELHEALLDTADTLTNTWPTSLAGAAALLRHVAEHEGAGNDFWFIDAADNKNKPWTYFLHYSLANALESVTTSAVVS
jgi:hypothetical protein